MINVRLDILEKLAEAIENNSAIAFVGSGLSIESGLPNWKEVLLLLASNIRNDKPDELEAARKAIDENRLLNAATLISDNVEAKDIFRDKIATEFLFSYHNAQKHYNLCSIIKLL